MGGTHVDAVLIHEGEIIDVVKKPTNTADLQELLWETLKELFAGKNTDQIERINLSTTVCTNAIIEDKIDPVGMIIESGPGLPRDFLACGLENVFIDGYIDHRGREIKPLNSREIEKAATKFKKSGIDAVSIVTKFSVRNPRHEKEIYELIEDEFWPITLGHTLSGKLNFPRRVFTSYYNSSVYTTFQRFGEGITGALQEENIKAPVYILKADGGAVSLEAGKNYPVETILSGPAASIMGTSANFSTPKDAVFMDIGGTTTDISFLADGVPLFEPLGIKIGKYPTLVRALYSVSLGVGGDSTVTVKNGKIEIGPQRQGPPKAFGGPRATPTDAMIVLGLIDVGDKDAAMLCIKEIGQQLGLSPKDTATEILDTMGEIIKEKVFNLLDEVNSHPVYTIKELLYSKRLSPESIYVIGGPAKSLAPILEQKFKIPCFYPKNYETANAVGAALSKITAEINMFVDTSERTLSVPEMGLYKNIKGIDDMESYRVKAMDLLREKAITLGAAAAEVESEIIEESSFNIVRGFYTRGKNIRIKAQTKPGLIYKLRGVENAQS